MKKKSLLIIPLFLFSIFLIGFSSGAVSLTDANITLQTPSASGTVTDQITLNATLDGTVTADQWINATFYAMSSSTANSSWVNIGSTLNTTGDLEFALVWNSTGIIEDSNDYIFNVTITNQTFTIQDTSTSVVVQNTVPTTPTSLSPADSSSDEDGSITFSATVTGSQTTGCTLSFVDVNPGQSSYTMTHTGNTCTHSLTSIPEQTYRYTITASDGTDTAVTGETTFAVILSSGNNPVSTPTTPKKSNTAIIVIAIIVILIIFWIFKKK